MLFTLGILGTTFKQQASQMKYPDKHHETSCMRKGRCGRVLCFVVGAQHKATIGHPFQLQHTCSGCGKPSRWSSQTADNTFSILLSILHPVCLRWKTSVTWPAPLSPGTARSSLAGRRSSP